MYGVIVPLRWPLKGPDADLDYTYNTSEDMEGLNDTILSVQVSIQPSGAGEMTVASLNFAQPYITAYLAGGVAGRDYLVKVKATTPLRTFEWAFNVLVDPTFATWPLPAPPSSDFGTVTSWP
jgi:hypothetical protein